MLKWIASHLSVSLLTGALVWISLHALFAEREQRLLAEQSLKASQATVASLQHDIATTAAQAQADRARLARALASVHTPAQAAAAIPSVPLLTDLPLHTRIAPDNPAQVSVDATALYAELNQCAQQTVELTACQKTSADLTQIQAQQASEIKVLKKKPSLLHRIGRTLETVGIGVGIGALLGAHL
jgi:cytoskeletal protein RodZ